MRAFVAVEITDEKTLGAIEKFQSGINIDGRAVKPENLHFTLQFLGEIPEEALQGIIDALSGVRFSEFDINLTGVGRFPKSEPPRTVWVGTNTGNRLVELGNMVREALFPLGFVPDKPFKPHITVFRIKKIVNMTLNEMDFGVQRVARIKLKKSEMTPAGPVYSDLAEVRAK